MIRRLLALILIFLAARVHQTRYTFDKFLGLGAFQAEVVGIVDLSGPPTFATALSGLDKRILLRTKAGETIVIDKVPTSFGGNCCGTINSWLPYF